MNKAEIEPEKEQKNWIFSITVGEIYDIFL